MSNLWFCVVYPCADRLVCLVQWIVEKKVLGFIRLLLKWRTDWRRMKRMRELYGIFSSFLRIADVLTATAWYASFFCWFRLFSGIVSIVSTCLFGFNFWITFSMLYLFFKVIRITFDSGTSGIGERSGA